ncbi:MARVEL domain-containing protein [Aspergillus ibericus CBS 121593]|uniref:MARVEL domain-containing protein n=1 Tax=Aspergillus ibericus CBS 121593 TaxID=1448316 RepID=A0A395GSW4_9EURO|nr:hypothetical protein BO80DRAFT_387399 [Aspergillus ibericus CBS 121593]RAK98506.1 hypothetical protein BO80DRAFT_387399 [Aspergillus ibericus CBS 121593]
MNPLIIAILRAFQLVFSVVVLGISISLAKGQHINSVPGATGYAAFTGGLGTLASLIGAAAIFIESFQTFLSWAIDGLASLAFVTGGIIYAVYLRNTNCSNQLTSCTNSIINGGSFRDGKKTICWYSGGKLNSRCTSAKADMVFMFLGFAVCAAVCGMVFLRRRKGGYV